MGYLCLFAEYYKLGFALLSGEFITCQPTISLKHLKWVWLRFGLNKYTY